MSDALTTDAATLRYRSLQGSRVILVDEMEPLFDTVAGANGVRVVDEDGKVVGTFTPASTSTQVWDDAAGTPEEDAEDVRRARLAMEDVRLNGSIPWAQVKAELGI